MIGRNRSRRPAPRPSAESTPVLVGATLNRPTRFVAKPEPVGVVWHDGSDAQLTLVAEWVLKVERDREVRFGIEPGQVLVIRPAWPSEPVRLRPGMYLVRRSAGWTVYSSEQFQASFEPLPRELPIFDDGEVA